MPRASRLLRRTVAAVRQGIRGALVPLVGLLDEGVRQPEGDEASQPGATAPTRDALVRRAGFFAKCEDWPRAISDLAAAGATDLLSELGDVLARPGDRLTRATRLFYAVEAYRLAGARDRLLTLAQHLEHQGYIGWAASTFYAVSEEHLMDFLDRG